MLEKNISSQYIDMEVLKDIPNVFFNIVTAFKCILPNDQKIYRVTISASTPETPDFACCEYYGTIEEINDKIQNFSGMIESFHDITREKIFS